MNMKFGFFRLFILVILCLFGTQSRAQILAPNYRELYTSDSFDARKLSKTDAATIYEHLTDLKPYEPVLQHSVGWSELDVPSSWQDYVQMTPVQKSHFEDSSNSLVREAKKINKKTALVLVGSQMEPLYAYMAGSGVNVVPLHISRELLEKGKWSKYKSIKLYIENLIGSELSGVNHILIVDTVANSDSQLKLVVDLFVEAAQNIKPRLQVHGFGILDPGSPVTSSDHPRISLSKWIRERPWKNVFYSQSSFLKGKYDLITADGEPYSRSIDFSKRLLRDMEKTSFNWLADRLIVESERSEDLLALRKRLRFLLHAQKLYDAGRGKSHVCAQTLSAI